MTHQKLPYPNSSLKRLCLLRLSAVGDCCNLLPVIRTLQQYLPNTELTWVIGKGEASLFRGLDGVELIEYDKNARTGPVLGKNGWSISILRLLNGVGDD